MKNILKIALVAVAIILPTIARAEGAKIGVMDLVRIGEEARVMKSLNSQRDAAVGKIRSEVEAKGREFRQKEQEVAAKRGLITDEAFMREASRFQADVVEYDRQTAARMAGIETAYLEALRKVQRDHLDDIAKKIGNQKGFDIIVNAQAAIIINSSLDITSEVIKELDSKIRELDLGIK